MADETRYWLLTGEVPTGPATVAEIHDRITSGSLTWQTKVCRVGETVWVPFIELTDAKPVTTSPVPNSSNIPVAKPVLAQPIVNETPIVNVSIPAIPSGNSTSKPPNDQPQFLPLLILTAVVLCGHLFNVAAMGKRRTKPDIRERFGYAVKVQRETLGLNQEELADKARIHRTYLSDVERGTRNLSLINIEKLAAALSLKMSNLFQHVEAES